MERDLADLSLKDEEDEILLLQIDSGPQQVVQNLYLVGYFLTASIVHFPAMNSTLENLWHPVKRVQISDLEGKRFLFKFFHKMDLDRVVNGALWIFNNHLLVFRKLHVGEDQVKNVKRIRIYGNGLGPIDMSTIEESGSGE
ncbi:hypothetical protein Gohar_020571 [Gossypium harknessii]|uniref:DUF4283 domain-containing protein n=1 Tax=Gossypium harknessii TaxID=34285 RepID=A0A7J9HZG8_9ROSI|nr:hypothetical protein [Gossypium harknessii]